jgi:hypothetical protein
MKIQLVCAIASAIALVSPILANGPMPGDSGGSSYSNGASEGMSPGRRHWTKHRIHELSERMSEYRKADRAAREMDRFQGAVDNNYGRFIVPEGASSTAQRHYMIDRFEYLALKAERGKATERDKAEMRALRGQLLPPRSH